MANDSPDLVDEAGYESFPASDSPAWTIDGFQSAPANAVHQQAAKARIVAGLLAVVIGFAATTLWLEITQPTAD